VLVRLWCLDKRKSLRDERLDLLLFQIWAHTCPGAGVTIMATPPGLITYLRIPLAPAISRGWCFGSPSSSAFICWYVAWSISPAA
jgi:hypothetical protein